MISENVFLQQLHYKEKKCIESKFRQTCFAVEKRHDVMSSKLEEKIVLMQARQKGKCIYLQVTYIILYLKEGDEGESSKNQLGFRSNEKTD